MTNTNRLTCHNGTPDRAVAGRKRGSSGRRASSFSKNAPEDRPNFKETSGSSPAMAAETSMSDK
jgi:hypothetical protein